MQDKLATNILTLSTLLGIVAFFLPWVEVSFLGFIRLRFSGYDFGTGQFQEKLAPERSRRTMDRLEEDFRRGLERGRGRTLPRANKPQKREPSEEKRQGNGRGAPLLWLVPSACLALLILCLFGLPRILTVGISTVAIVYLGYISVVSEQQLNDPANTLGLLDHHWLTGFWLTWLGLLLPPVLVLTRPARKSPEAPPSAFRSENREPLAPPVAAGAEREESITRLNLVDHPLREQGVPYASPRRSTGLPTWLLTVLFASVFVGIMYLVAEFFR